MITDSKNYRYYLENDVLELLKDTVHVLKLGFKLKEEDFKRLQDLMDSLSVQREINEMTALIEAMIEAEQYEEAQAKIDATRVEWGEHPALVSCQAHLDMINFLSENSATVHDILTIEGAKYTGTDYVVENDSVYRMDTYTYFDNAISVKRLD